MKKIIQYFIIYFSFIYEEYIYSDFSDLKTISKLLIKPFYYISFLYWYILSVICFPFFIFKLVFYEDIKKSIEISQLIVADVFNNIKK